MHEPTGTVIERYKNLNRFGQAYILKAQMSTIGFFVYHIDDDVCLLCLLDLFNVISLGLSGAWYFIIYHLSFWD